MSQPVKDWSIHESACSESQEGATGFTRKTPTWRRSAGDLLTALGGVGEDLRARWDVYGAVLAAAIVMTSIKQARAR